MLKRNAILAAKLTVIASLFATSISSWQNYSANGYVGWHSFANGLVDGFFIVGFLSTYKLIISDVLLRRFFSRLSFVRTLILNSIAYSFLILFGRALGRFIMEYEHFVLLPTGTDIARQHFYQALGAALIFSLLLNFLLQNSRLLGPRVMANFITGRYHHPIYEKRIVLFMDLKSSTTLTEKLGDQRYLDFMSETFSDLTEAIIATDAEIYKYVGDEIILSWPVPRGLREGNCLKLPLLIQKFFEEHSEHYKKRYGHSPEFRTGIHMGELVIGEVGVLKREIALIGDVMNTAARIAAYTRECGQNLLISGELKDALEKQREYQFSPLGPVVLRGKADGIELFSIARSS
ncbi:adenylate/guanylate cyclase domain-containing protein [Turneriella parva]|uniref:Adenylate/guanylate cyclase n=1 Tax=Turneriella parva (strain ATCC BAA-1111 / DSM 21527 / NCTC 11395 / H) TaxID=869212 RepID=I4B9X9_TURPD|nr:adenylate/guanylate cyclase domain-containing protein [Turneriella parva]AFM14086.1 adenylate/guanylate cyclase [Turneriella parva DSM 21527]